MPAVKENPTKELPEATPFEQRVLAEFAALRSEVAEIRIQQVAMARNIAVLDQRLTSLDQRVTSMDQRLTSLEEKVDSRLKETRPIWEAVQAQIKKLDGKFDLFILDLYEIRSDLRLQDKRLSVLERRVLT
jgi:chromosome segregation ATPase